MDGECNKSRNSAKMAMAMRYKEVVIMAKTYNRMHIEIGKQINSIGIRPVAGDTNSRYLDVSLYDSGVPINLTGQQVRINYLKENGRTFFNQGEITDAAAGRCQFALTNDVISDVQTLKAQISIWGENEILSTETFKIYVSESIRCDDAVEGTNEFGVLVVLFNEIQNALDLMQAISDGFGKPGDKAAEYGVNTFWGILEILAGRTDVETVLKNSINSKMGTDEFEPLNELLLNNILPKIGHGVQTFTADGTFTVPAGVTKILVTACGGGGGGSGARTGSTLWCGHGGGGGACIVRKPYNVTPGQQIPITIGAGGANGGSNSSNPTAGSKGGSTVIGSIITLAGGDGGAKTVYQKSAAGGDGGGYGGSGGSDSSAGECGQNGTVGSGGFAFGRIIYTSSYPAIASASGGGGGGSLGNGGNGGNVNGNATNPGYGGGGGGAYYGTYTTATKGGNGIAIIEW